MSFDVNGALSRWQRCTVATLEWLAARPMHDGCVDSKLNPLTLQDYGPQDGLRGPDWTYGWIQGRALEALVTHAAALDASHPALARQLDQMAHALYARLKGLQARDGHIYFLYDRSFAPVRPEGEGVAPQAQPAAIYTYSDCFAAKGLIAAAARFAPQELPQHLAYFGQVIAAIQQDRFQMDEKVALSPQAVAQQPDDFGPKMIALGACRLFETLGLAPHAEFGTAFLAKILAKHYDPDLRLLRNVPGAPEVNAGHAIELVGFALSSTTLRASADLAHLRQILRGAFEFAFADYGLRLSMHAGTGAALNPRLPWWSLPETIRAAAWAYHLGQDPQDLAILQRADQAFFTHFWREGQGLAYQTLDGAGQPIDFVPATPDLDPGYHTGLSLLAASEAFSSPSDDRPR